METALNSLLITAASLAFAHTLLGVDHYLPFIVMGRSGKWSLKKTVGVAAVCGIGHILSSVLLGVVGIAFGIGVTKLEILESYRGNMAAWLLIAFGFVYMIWGIRQAVKNKKHSHFHAHNGGVLHSHDHTHHEEHMHVHKAKGRKTLTPWILFTIFVFGPCEPLIPILMFPAFKESVTGVFMVTAVFSLVTFATMLSMVVLGTKGIQLISMKPLERYMHAVAGASIFMCGMCIELLGI